MLSKILNENNYSDEDCILILRTISNKSKKLINYIRKIYQKTKNLDQIISSATKPPIFWKDKDKIKIQVNKLGPKRI